MRTDTISVPEIHCDHCRSAIEGALLPLDGVQTAQVDIPRRIVQVTWDDQVVDRRALLDAIEEQGYEVPE